MKPIPLFVACVVLSTACERRTSRNDQPPPPPPPTVAPVAPAQPVAPIPVVPTPVQPAAPTPAPPTPPPPVEPVVAAADAGVVAAPEAPAVDALSLGRHRCSFTEAGSDYSRRCEVSAMPDGSMEIVARGTRLNRDNGFTLNARGTAPAYEVRGTLTAFAGCSGPVTGTLRLEGSHSRPYYQVRWGQGCQITIQL